MSEESRTIVFPDGLSQTLIGILASHVGRESAIGRSALVMRVRQCGYSSHERVVRECIKQLRRTGYLICAMPGIDGGYYLAANKQEFDEFDHLEFGAKIADMNETRLAMKETARQQFGDAVQLGMGL